MHPGDTYGMTLKIKLPSPIPGGATTVQNCADLPWSTGGLPANDNPAPPIDISDSVCIDTNVDAGFDLKVEKTGPVECYEGGLCDYAISVTNGGPRPFNGIIAVKDTLPAGSMVETSSGVWSCVAFAPGTMTCGISRLPVGAGDDGHLPPRRPASRSSGRAIPSRTAPRSTGPIPSSSPAPPTPATTTRRLTGRLASSRQCSRRTSRRSARTVCEKGAICTLDVSIDNRGGRLFKGAAGLRGTLDSRGPRRQRQVDDRRARLQRRPARAPTSATPIS